jgi:BirA family biotin operon repressor/biotin-[acetyl-CoA-carboxylase] ligase
MVLVEPAQAFQPVHHAVLPSTNDEARRLALGGAADFTIVWADQQTAGRGRLDRQWVSPQGNLYASFVLRPAIAPARAAEIGFVAALAVAETIADLVPTASVTLKWPNDVLVQGRKIAGLLLEAHPSSDGELGFVVLGIGINIASHPEAARYPAISLAAIDPAIPSVESVLRRLSTALGATLAFWRDVGFPAILDRWTTRAHGLGEPIVVTTGPGSVMGVFQGLAPDGALLVETASGIRSVTVGDVGAAPV